MPRLCIDNYSIELFNEALWAQDPSVTARQAFENLIDQIGPDDA